MSFVRLQLAFLFEMNGKETAQKKKCTKKKAANIEKSDSMDVLRYDTAQRQSLLVLLMSFNKNGNE